MHNDGNGVWALNERAELGFLLQTLEKMNLQAILMDEGFPLEERLDFSLRKLLGDAEAYDRIYREAQRWAKERTVYRMTDSLLCRYVFLILPETPKRALLIGPYMAFHMTEQQIMEEAEALKLSAWKTKRLEEYYANVVVLPDDAPLFAMINTLAERLWGSGDSYEIVDVNYETTTMLSPRPSMEENDAAALEFHMQAMETRYAYENELMEVVSKGLVHRAEQMLNASMLHNVEKRSADPLRSIKYYCVSCNTLLRKAAESGGVHPVYLDSASSGFAREIDSLNTLLDGQELIGRMAQSYCRLVRKHATQKYSAPVQRALLYIDANLSSVLSLKLLADLQGINPSYLSTIFKKETGVSVTEHINRQRIDMACRLLGTTKLQIQTIAQHCGISDVNYFSKLFKKFRDKTPKEYRLDIQKQIL